MKAGIFYGSTMGTTKELANQIAILMNIDPSDMYDVSDVSIDKVDEYDLLLLGSSTWGLGELQDDWYDFLGKLKNKDLSGKNVGLFGCGDSESYEDTFCDALAIIHCAIENSGCKFVGEYEPTDYSIKDLIINKNNKFIGLAIDDNNESDLTASRTERWISIINES